MVKIVQGDLDRAYSLCQETLDDARRSGSLASVELFFMINRARIAFLRGNLQEARDFCLRALAYYLPLRRLDMIAYIQLLFPRIELALDDLPSAREKALQAYEYFRRLDIPPSVQECEQLLLILDRQGDLNVL